MDEELYVGLMSGTSMDGIDAVLAGFGSAGARALHAIQMPWPAEIHDELQQMCLEPDSATLPRVAALDVRTGEQFASAALRVIRESGVVPSAIMAIGSHGQTILHRPHGCPRYTVQIGDPAIIAVRTGLPVVADFRRGDVALGGQGAPLVPAFHRYYFGRPGEAAAVVNIGGIANVSIITAGGAVIAYDTGPGNCLLDRWVQLNRRTVFDDNGAWAASGDCHELLSRELMADPWFEAAPPKSTGVDKFNLTWLQSALDRLAEPPAPEDVQATLAELTASTVAAALRKHAATTVAVAGGGARNGDLLARLQRHLPGCTVRSSVDWGLDPSLVEPMAFAWLARERMHGRPGNVPSATGASAALSLGGVYLPPV